MFRNSLWMSDLLGEVAQFGGAGRAAGADSGSLAGPGGNDEHLFDRKPRQAVPSQSQQKRIRIRFDLKIIRVKFINYLLWETVLFAHEYQLMDLLCRCAT